ncbi:hypothetical protein C0993_002647 [Termitomyces sp. T159_Od127]|nr:hypothetical protein C0993_002647 [Termitomyces sp. T159_Od127]
MSLPEKGQECDTERSEQMKREPQVSDNDILVSQVRAFLEAAEDVDIDVETVEDLMQSLPPDFGSEIDPVGELELTDDDGLDEDMNVNGHRLIREVDTPVRYEIEEQDRQIWTPQEIKEMIHHLKERGMASWITEYVVTRNHPIQKLLRIFGINLVIHVLHHVAKLPLITNLQCEALQTKKPNTLLYFLKVALSRVYVSFISSCHITNDNSFAAM